MKAGTAEKKAARAMGKYRKRGFLLAFLAPCTILFLIVYAYPLVTIFLTSFCKWNYENFTAPEFLGWSMFLCTVRNFPVSLATFSIS